MANLPVSLASYKPNFGTSDGADPEYAIPVGRGYRARFTLPANWTVSPWAFSAWAVASFASNDGKNHVLFEARKDADNFIRVTKLVSGAVELRTRAAGTEKSTTITPTTWAAGSIQFFGAYFDGATATLNVNGSTATISSAGSFASSGWVVYCGSNWAQYDNWEGYLNLLVASEVGFSVTARFNSGNGQHFKDWAYTYFANVVAYVNGTATTGKVDTYQGATDGLAVSATGRVSLNGTTQYVNNGNRTQFNAISKFWVLFEVERTSGGRIDPVFTRWDTGDVTKQQFRMLFGATDAFAARMGDGAGNDYVITTNASTFPVGWRGMGLLRVDLTQATDAARVKFDVSAYDATTGKYAAWTQPTLGFSGAAPATLITVATLNLLVGAMTNGAGISDFFSGKIDTIAYGTGEITATGAISDTLRDLMTAGETLPYIADHAYFYEGDANDQIRTVNGTLVGSPSFVDDGRTGLGRFEKYAKRGRLMHDGSGSNNVDFGTFNDLNGARAFTVFGVFTPGGRPTADVSNSIIGVYDGTTSANKQFAVLWEINGGNVWLKSVIWNEGLAAEASGHTPNNSLVQGTEYAYVVRYDGSQATNATKLRIWLAARDRTTGLFGTLTEQTLSFGGTVPASLRVVSGVKLYQGRWNDGQAQFKGMIDDVRIWANDALDPTALTSILLYQERDGMASASVRSPDRWWTLDNTGNDRTYGGSRMSQVIRPTFARADTGTQIYSDGVVRAVASGELANKHWIKGNNNVDYVTTLIQRAFTNLTPSDDITSWSTSGTPTVTGAISDPAGGTGAYRVTNNDGLAGTQVFKNITYTGDGVKTEVFAVSQGTMPGSGNQDIGVFDTTAAAYRLLLHITGWVAGKPTISVATGTLLGMRLIGNGYWAIYANTAAVTAANTNKEFVVPATAAGQATASINVYRANAYNDVAAPDSMLAASEVITADNLSLGAITPQALSVVWEGVLVDTPNGGVNWYHLFNIGNSDDPATGGFGVFLDKATGSLGVKYTNKDSGANVSPVLAVALARYDRLRVLATLSATGVIQLTAEVNGGATTSSTASAANALSATSWSDTALHVGHPTVAQNAVMAVTQIKVQSLVKTLAQMDAIFRPDLAHYAVGQQAADVDGTVNAAIQWFDGRQPSGWSFGAGAEFERATGTNQVNAGTYGFRVKKISDTDALFVTSGTAAIGDLVLWAGMARATALSVKLAKTESGAFSTTRTVTIPVAGSLALVGRMDRAEAAGTVTVNARVSSSGEAYLDSMVAVKFAAVAFDVLQLNGLPASANCMFVYPNYADVSDLYTPTFSGGSWRVALPNSNLQTTITKEVTRSTDATTAYTQFVADLKTAWSIRALLLGGHNLSLNALIRIRASASADGVTSPLYDTDWVLAYPPAYPLNTLQAGHPAYSDRMLTAFDWADARNRYAFTHVLPANVAARYWSFQVNDTANADGYVEFGRLFMGWAYQPTYNIKPGAQIGYQTQTARYTADDDTPYYDERTNIRPVNISFDSQDYNEALVFAFDELMRKQGTNRQIGFIWDPTDEENLHRRSMLCTLSQLGNLQHTNTATEDDVTIQLLETP